MSSRDELLGSNFRFQKYLLDRQKSLESQPALNREEIDNIKKILKELQNHISTIKDIKGNNIQKKDIMISLLEEEVKQMRHNVKSMNQRKLNKKRLIQIYDYEKSKYYAKIEVLKVIAYTMLAVLFVFILKRLILPKTIAMGLASIIIAIGIIYVIYKMYDISIRDPLHFNKYFQPIDATLIQKEVDASYNTANNIVSDDVQISNLNKSKCGKVSDNADIVL